MGEKSVTGQDVTLLRDILALTRPDTTGSTATDAAFGVFEMLEHLLRSDYVTFQEKQVGPGQDFRRLYLQVTAAGQREIVGEEELAAFDRDNPPNTLHEYWWQLPCSLVDRTGLPQLTSIRMFLGQRAWAAHPVQREHRSDVDEILLAYPLGGGRSLRVLAVRGSGRAFGLRELTLMELLMPHLRPLLQATLGEHVQVAAAGVHPGLTARQREILHLVAVGLANKQVGRQLGISEGTVRKHLENVYERLGVQSRTEAIFRMRAGEVSTG